MPCSTSPPASSACLNSNSTENSEEPISAAKKGLQTLVQNAKKESDKRFDPNDPATRRIFANYESAAQKVEPTVSIKMRGATILGNVLDKESVYAGSAIVNMAWSDGQTQADMPFAASFAWMRIGKQQVEVSVLYPFRDATSVTSANQKLLEWIADVEKQNKQD